MKRMSFFQSKSLAQFSPADLANLRQWYKSDGNLTKNSSDLVSQWEDMSGNGNHLDQSNNYYKPTWVDNQIDGKPVIRFDYGINGGYSKHLNFTNHATNLFTNNQTIFYVFKKPYANSAAIGFESSNVYYNFIDYLTNSIYVRDGSYVYWDSNGGQYFTVFGILTLLGTSSGFRLFKNETELESEKSLLMNADLYYFGGDPIYWSTNTDWVEVIVYDRRLSDSERAQVYQYLKTKYPSLP